MSPSSHSLVLADSPLRQRLAALRAEAESLRDAIAALDLDIETLRTTLGVFDARVHGALREPYRLLQRISGVVRHLERWAELLQSAPPAEVARRARRLDARRGRELRSQAQQASSAAEPMEALPLPDEAAELKSLYRRLARRYHPDLAHDEEEQLRAAKLMARINALYRARDLAGLRALADQALGTEPAEEVLSLTHEVTLLSERCQRFRAVLEGLREELASLECCPTARLWREVTAREGEGEDAFRALRKELGERAQRAYEDVRAGAHALEEAVRRYNRNATEMEASSARAMGRAFDAHLRQPLVRLSLESLAALRASRDGRARADWLVEQAVERPAVVRLVLFTYAAELVPGGLEGLATLEGLRQRFDALSVGQPVRLEEALVDASEWLELAVRRAGPRVVQTGLRFRDAALAEAVPLGLRSHALRGEFRRVLSTLGERTQCPACAADVFALPLFRLRGLDDLHASVCPACGQTLKSYWMPRGKDVQTVLNDAFLDLELVTEWTFRLGRAAVSTQLLPAQLEALTVGQLKRRFVDDVLLRHGVEVGERHVRLMQGQRPALEKRLLADCESRTFAVAFASGAPMSVAEALERVRYRIRTRFRPETPPEKDAR
jgi:curved DNA-binding protein CbpA